MLYQLTETSSTMRVVYLSLVFLFPREIENIHSPALDSGHLNSARSPSRDWSPQSLPGSNFNPCDKRKINSGAQDAQSACQNECLALKAEISTIYNAYPDYKTLKYLFNKCGMVTEGKCSTGGDFPVCLCITLKESMKERETTQLTCSNGIKIMRQFTTAVKAMSSKNLANGTKKRTNYQEMGGEVEAVGMYDSGASSSRPVTRPRTADRRRQNPRFCCGVCDIGSFESPSAKTNPPAPRPQQQGEEDWNSRQDGDPEGRYLVTDVRVSGKVVRALLDTGCDFSLIHPTLAGIIVPVTGRSFVSESGQQFQITGKTTINVEIRRDISITLTGYVLNQKFEIFLGTDFFVAYAAKLRIFDRKMDIFTGQTAATMIIKFRDAPAGTFMMSSSRVVYTALQIQARVNGFDTKMVIDTGSTLTIVNEEFVNQQIFRPVATTASVGGASPVGFKGTAQIDLQIESHCFTLRVLVPEFKPTDNFLTGNDFNKRYIELIDYKSKSVTLTYRNSVKITVPAFVMQGK